MRLEFGNPEHIKLANDGYRLGLAIEKGLEGRLLDQTEQCDQCDGKGEVVWFECENCGNAGEAPFAVIYTENAVRHDKLNPELIGRCRECLAKLH